MTATEFPVRAEEKYIKSPCASPIINNTPFKSATKVQMNGV